MKYIIYSAIVIPFATAIMIRFYFMMIILFEWMGASERASTTLTGIICAVWLVGLYFLILYRIIEGRWIWDEDKQS